MKRKVCVVTGSRAEYGILYPVLKAIESAPSLKLQLVATGMHLMPEFGYSVDLIRKDGFAVKTVDMTYVNDSAEATTLALSKGMAGLTKIFKQLTPDVVLILGDRAEVFAAAIVASYLNIPVAHIHGGEVSGHIDGSVRHAITKLVHLHFAATPQSAMRIRKLGEESWRIKTVGAPALDRIKSGQVTSKNELYRKYHLVQDKDVVMVLQHPVHTQMTQGARQIEMTIKCLLAFDVQVIGIYPNADAGGRMMISKIKSFVKKGQVDFYKNIPHGDYLGLLKTADLLIGNSSSGIIEAPAFGLPVINLGDRQKGREVAANVLHVPFKEEKIRQAIRKCLYNDPFKRRVKTGVNPYGTGNAGKLIAAHLSRVKLDKSILEKNITY